MFMLKNKPCCRAEHETLSGTEQRRHREVLGKHNRQQTPKNSNQRLMRGQQTRQLRTWRKMRHMRRRRSQRQNRLRGCRRNPQRQRQDVTELGRKHHQKACFSKIRTSLDRTLLRSKSQSSLQSPAALGKKTRI